MKRAEITGKRFGRLAALEYVGKSRWNCRCDCGNEVARLGSHLTSGASKSCGCLRVDANKERTKHGMRHTTEYTIWCMIKARTENPKTPGWKDYGGRGIKMCARWSQSFPNFYADMGAKPITKHSIDRVDNDGNYEPGNCRWATRQEQNSNTRRNIYIEWNGVTKSLPNWALERGVRLDVMYRRYRSGMATEQIMFQGVLPKR